MPKTLFVIEMCGGMHVAMARTSYDHTDHIIACSYIYLLTRFVMKELFAALKTGLVEEVKRVFKETDISPTVCDEV